MTTTTKTSLITAGTILTILAVLLTWFLISKTGRSTEPPKFEFDSCSVSYRSYPADNYQFGDSGSVVFIHVSVKNTGGDYNWEVAGYPMGITAVLKDSQGNIYRQHEVKGEKGDARDRNSHDPYAYIMKKDEVFTYLYVYDAPIPNGEYTLTFSFSDTEFVVPVTIEWPESF